MISAILAVVGFAVLLYPTAASWTHQYHQASIIDTFHEEVKHAEPSGVEQFRQARRYNDALTSGARLAPNANIPLSDVKETESALGLWDYEDILNLYNTGIMGRVLVPKADVDVPIYHGTSENTLLKGAGHLQGTSLPVGGAGTRAVITAHRGLAEATMFTHLDKIEVGDDFSLNIFEEVLAYRVIEVQVVEPEDSEAIKPVEGKDLVTLVTCTPLGINTQRILVTGERIYPTPAKDEAAAKGPSNLPHFPWFAIVYAVVFISGMTIAGHSLLTIIAIKKGNQNPAHRP
ncbi:hypothetical protein BM477_07005 [Boudabousia marimammalium]|uniref:Class C sortase n=2 Tax=Boudabousia marimammalium TaxID=156892 RepID=A0A1Q5PKF7_9ACTO|nr:hypothetical protein BM477_07005 [Boudabousia marimammalium]